MYTLHFSAGNGVAPGATQTFTLTVNEPSPPPPPPPVRPRPITAAFITVKAGKKKRLAVLVSYADTGAEKMEFPSPFQKPAFKGFQVGVVDSNGDGVPDTVVLSARKGKKTVTVTFAG